MHPQELEAEVPVILNDSSESTKVSSARFEGVSELPGERVYEVSTGQATVTRSETRNIVSPASTTGSVRGRGRVGGGLEGLVSNSTWSARTPIEGSRFEQRWSHDNL
jgi:hypothetical protein